MIAHDQAAEALDEITRCVEQCEYERGGDWSIEHAAVKLLEAYIRQQQALAQGHQVA